ncbi:hypothetical protein Zm00014a_018158 [Zea mays]|uniref:Uncharacterized protein n=1 Tax=Zea mays TaxID=4577 RepID=A0A3L6E590_MAIZE|nr:hypothetical protein Zm00014a_018158 [Zea mays]
MPFLKTMVWRRRWRKFSTVRAKHIIKLVLSLTKETMSVHAAEECLALKDTAWVLLIQGEQLPGCIPDTAQGILHAPQLTLAAEAILTNQLQLSI